MQFGIISAVPCSTTEELKRAELGAAKAFKSWRQVPVQQRQVKSIVICKLYFLISLNFNIESFLQFAKTHS